MINFKIDQKLTRKVIKIRNKHYSLKQCVKQQDGQFSIIIY